VAVFQLAPGADPSDILEELSADLVATYAQLEAQLTQEIAKRLREGLEVYPSMTERLAAARALQATARELVAGVDTDALAERILLDAAERGVAAAAQRLRLARNIPRPTTVSGLPPAAVDAVTALRLDLVNTLDAVGRRIVRNVPDDYQRIVGRMAPELLLGSATPRVLQQRTIDRFLERGLTGFTDARGRRWRIGSYVEMATRTAVGRARTDAGIARMAQSGINLVSILVGRSACDRCAPWAGKILSTDGSRGTVMLQHATEDRLVQVRIDGTLDDARAAGWGHPNDKCQCASYLPGLPIAADSTAFDPERHAAHTRLRELERRKRARLRVAEGAGDEVTARRQRKRIREIDTTIREHVAATGITRRRYRESLTHTGG
jgi:hypothetical protein